MRWVRNNLARQAASRHRPCAIARALCGARRAAIVGNAVIAGFGVSAALHPDSAAAWPIGPITNFGAGLAPGTVPLKIVAGPDGNLWFTASYPGPLSAIGRITPGGQITEFKPKGSWRLSESSSLVLRKKLHR
jgi:streptogramin lyase